jgi:antitoxin (DNA-binding transcriptional repressor) of toxin-antitoxin stability system
VTRAITERDLRTRSGEIVRGLEAGEEYLLTRDGVPIGRLVPIGRPTFVSAHAVVAAFAGAPAVDITTLRADLDRVARPT